MISRSPSPLRAACFLLALAGAPSWAAGPVFSDAGPDAEAYGKALGYPVGGRVVPVPQADMVGHYSHFAEKYPSRVASRPAIPSPWQRADHELAMTYSYEGVSHDLPDYLSRHPATG